MIQKYVGHCSFADCGRFKILKFFSIRCGGGDSVSKDFIWRVSDRFISDRISNFQRHKIELGKVETEHFSTQINTKENWYLVLGCNLQGVSSKMTFDWTVAGLSRDVFRPEMFWIAWW